jgi:hypothetical protein
MYYSEYVERNPESKSMSVEHMRFAYSVADKKALDSDVRTYTAGTPSTHHVFYITSHRRVRFILDDTDLVVMVCEEWMEDGWFTYHMAHTLKN